jgi:hypothetical protein
MSTRSSDDTTVTSFVPATVPVATASSTFMSPRNERLPGDRTQAHPVTPDIDQMAMANRQMAMVDRLRFFCGVG